MGKSTKKAKFMSPVKICRGKTGQKAAAVSVEGKAKTKELKKKKQLGAAAPKQQPETQADSKAGAEDTRTPANKVRRLSSPDSGQREGVAAVMELKKKAAASGKSVSSYMREGKKREAKKSNSSEDCMQILLRLIML